MSFRRRLAELICTSLAAQGFMEVSSSVIAGWNHSSFPLQYATQLVFANMEFRSKKNFFVGKLANMQVRKQVVQGLMLLFQAMNLYPVAGCDADKPSSSGYKTLSVFGLCPQIVAAGPKSTNCLAFQALACVSSFEFSVSNLLIGNKFW